MVHKEIEPHKYACNLYALKKSYVIWIHKDKYRAAVKNCKRRITQNKQEFLNKIELTSMFTRNSQKNLTKFLTHERRLNRHEFLYKEGELADKIYLLIKGKFKITKRIVAVDKRSEEHTAQVESIQAAGQCGKSNVFPLKKRNKNHPSNRKMQTFDLITVEKSGTIGEEDAFIDDENHKYRYTCQCVDDHALVYELKREDFLKEAKKQPQWGDIVQMVKEKGDKFLMRILLKNQV